MSAIRSSGTTPERNLEAIARASLPRRKFLLHPKSLPGSPDVYIPSLKLVIFADGCFWHSCPRHGNVPLSRQEYWVPKLAATVARDRSASRKLRRRGISVWHVWEHDLKGPRLKTTAQRLDSRLKARDARYQISRKSSSI
jgi:DNA mismatch endonuclease (patch repair protein)